MATCAELYRRYADLNQGISANEAIKILNPYIEQFHITISDKEIILDFGKNPISTISLERVCAIVDEADNIYIILNSCIYVLFKSTSEIKINLRD